MRRSGGEGVQQAAALDGQRLAVNGRTVRADVERLRSLGDPVPCGYRLGAGAMLPPLLLDDEETITVGLRTATGSAVAGRGGVAAGAGEAGAGAAVAVAASDDVAAYVSRRVSGAAWRSRAQVTMHAPAEVVADRVGPAAGTAPAAGRGPRGEDRDRR